jgi:hypothetical protein
MGRRVRQSVTVNNWRRTNVPNTNRDAACTATATRAGATSSALGAVASVVTRVGTLTDATTRLPVLTLPARAAGGCCNR